LSRYATVIALTNSVELARISNRQRAQHHRVNQGEDGCGAANSQGQSEHGRNGKNRRQPELPQNITNIADHGLHHTPRVH
jgi:hypothetical protein